MFSHWMVIVRQQSPGGTPGGHEPQIAGSGGMTLRASMGVGVSVGVDVSVGIGVAVGVSTGADV